MTDENKAEEYVNKKLCSLCREEKSKTKCATCPTYLTAYICYLDGLAEGRKELEKENAEQKQKLESDQLALNEANEIIAELKYNLKCRDDELAESKAEINQIIERERVVPEHYLCEMIDKNKELKAQVEKMKCCNNCKNAHYDWREQVLEGICNECRNYNKWESAE